MSWNFDEPINRRGTFSVKYDLRKEIFGTNDIIPMWVADMDFKTPDFIISSLKKRLEHEILGYSIRPAEYYSTIAKWMKNRYNWQIKPEWICFSPGIVPALSFSVLAFTEPGESIIVQPPVYFPFFSAVEAHGRKLIYNQLVEKGQRWEMDFDNLKASVDKRTKAILISNPHNPVGRAWTSGELLEIAGYCLKRNIIIISDEIHSDLTMPGFRHTPIASLSDEIASITVTLTAPSKTFNLAGLSTSSVIISDGGLRKKFSNLIEKLHVGNGNIFGTIASIEAYENGKEWLENLVTYISDNFKYVIDYLANNIPEINASEPEATYMIWLDCRRLGMNGKELHNFFISKAGIGMNEGSTFGPGGEGFMRMNIATTRAVLKQAMDQISQAITEYKNQKAE
ncbi:MAG TPA: PatB family C-S lyase [Bacteroidales bacterium]|nr:PatB family C-S lyase [Bacteroidales bacterium]